MLKTSMRIFKRSQHRSYWHDYFSTITQNDSSAVHTNVVDRFKVYAQQPSVVHKQADNNPSQAQVTAYVQAYRFYGHQVAATNPLFENTTSLPCLTPKAHGFSADNCAIAPTLGANNLAELTAHLRAVYAGPVSLETAHITDDNERTWLYTTLAGGVDTSVADQKTILDALTRAEGIEQYLP